MFANIYLYLPLIFSIGEKRHVVEYDKLRFQPEIICNAVCEECLQISIYIYNIFSQMVSHGEYVKLRYQSEIICNAVCEECLQISIYFYPLFFQMVSHDMLLSMINSDFSEKSFVMLYLKNVCKYLFIFILIFSIGEKRHGVDYDKLRFQPEIICNAVCEECLQISIYIYTLFSQMVSKHVVEYDKLRFQPEIICNAVCEECLQISIYFYPLFSQMESRDLLLSMINSDFCQKLFVMLYVENVCKYLFIFTPYFLKWCLKTCC